MQLEPPDGDIGLVLFAVTAVYLLGVGAWAALRALFGDRWAWLFYLNSLALLLFLPLPLALVAALLTVNGLLLAGGLTVAALFAVFWGWLFLPKPRITAGSPGLTVLTCNLLGANRHPDGVVRALRASQADVIGLVELNRLIATAIDRELRNEYPYRQLLADEEGKVGAGILSRMPFTAIEHDLNDPEWVSPPRVFRLDFAGRSVLFLRVHTPSRGRWTATRERHARMLADFARRQDEPLIIAGDFNATALNRSYAILTSALRDAWREGGHGFGHTFPGASKRETPGASRPRIFGISVPRWLIRIDHVFVSQHWQVVSARTGPFDGHSDHRPVVAELELRVK